ncbi:hypothetical protein EVAR_84864_1 [Eumeta japonica]|uniref:Uncharacterized protein n=1 Tax=Eumeta variegata TaxID=151549 RepID=A0A4C1Z5Z6_EUMVA|nr:hypothetical protein EVAR_84864_1 [Eumeta japonica]
MPAGIDEEDTHRIHVKSMQRLGWRPDEQQLGTKNIYTDYPAACPAATFGLTVLGPLHAPTQIFEYDIKYINDLHRVRSDGTCECRRRVTCAMDDAWWKSSRHRMSQETVTGRFPSLLPGRRRLAAAGWSKELKSMT